MLDESGYAWSERNRWSFKRLLSSKFLLDQMDLKAQRLLNNQTHCYLFISDWKDIVLPGVTLSFKQLKWRKVSLLYLWLNVYLVVSINNNFLRRPPVTRRRFLEGYSKKRKKYIKRKLKYVYKLRVQERFKNRTNITNTNYDWKWFKTVSVVFKLRLYYGRDTLREWTMYIESSLITEVIFSWKDKC